MTKPEIPSSRWFSLLMLMLSVLVIALAGREFRSVHEKQVIVRGPGVTAVVPLSRYFPGLQNTAGDTDVYILESSQPGGTLLILGGVHANEPAGMLTAVVVIENAKLNQGRCLVIPQANASAATHVEPSEGFPTRFSIRSAGGAARWFRFGGRLTNPIHQWPDPEVYTHYPSGQLQSDFDVRNLDRAFPGRPDGCLTEKIAYGITQLIRAEKPDLTIDLHEARPMNPIVNCVISHERAQEISTLAAINLESAGIRLRLEPSPNNLHGMSHRELGDHTATTALLMETANPIIDRLHGRASEKLILDGRDEFFRQAAQKDLLYVPYGREGLPMEERVGRHLGALLVFIQLLGELIPGKTMVIENLPGYQDVKKNGIGGFLRELPRTVTPPR